MAERCESYLLADIGFNSSFSPVNNNTDFKILVNILNY
jgi:hypothetical protein